MATDQEIRDKGIKFLPQQKYLQSPYQFNEPVVEEETESFGIPQTQAFTNSGGNDYTGGYNFGNTGFQQAVDDRQNRLNKPTDTSTFMGRTMGTIRDFIEPQSASQIMTDGYQEPRFQPGIIGMMMGKLDNYRNLPQADQAFIAQNMGYTGPTIFGENNSGLGKDPFGINTRSAFGNYAEYVKELYEDDEDKVYDPKLQAFKYNRKQFNDKKYEELLNTKKELTQIDKDNALAGKSSPGDKSRTGSLGRRPGSGGNVERRDSGPDRNTDSGDTTYDSGGREGFGYGLKDGGRAGYFFGGRARLQGGGMSQGNESNISQSTNMGGGITGDLSTARQTANHDRAMKNNQKPPESILKKTMDLGSELSYLNNLKNLNVPGIALNFGVNKFRNFLENRKTKEEDKLSYNTNDLPTNNYTAKLVGPALAQRQNLEKKQAMEQYGGSTFDTQDQNLLNQLNKMDQEETIYSQPIFTAANGGRAMFKNGGLASIL